MCCSYQDTSKMAGINWVTMWVINPTRPRRCQSRIGQSCPAPAAAVKMKDLEWKPDAACQHVPAGAAAAAGKTPSAPSGAAQKGRHPRRGPPPTPPPEPAVAGQGRRTNVPAAAAHQAAQPGRGREKQAMAASGWTWTHLMPGTGIGHQCREWSPSELRLTAQKLTCCAADAARQCPPPWTTGCLAPKSCRCFRGGGLSAAGRATVRSAAAAPESRRPADPDFPARARSPYRRAARICRTAVWSCARAPEALERAAHQAADGPMAAAMQGSPAAKAAMMLRPAQAARPAAVPAGPPASAQAPRNGATARAEPGPLQCGGAAPASARHYPPPGTEPWPRGTPSPSAYAPCQQIASDLKKKSPLTWHPLWKFQSAVRIALKTVIGGAVEACDWEGWIMQLDPDPAV